VVVTMWKAGLMSLLGRTATSTAGCGYFKASPLGSML